MRKKRKKISASEIEVWYDGACEPINPGGYASYGVLIKADGSKIWDESRLVGFGPEMSNNVAEYSGLLAALKKLIVLGLEKSKILVRGDNMMTIRQSEGVWRCRGGLYEPYFREVQKLIGKFPHIRFQWIPREQNSEADKLSKRVLIKSGVRFEIQPQDSKC